MRIIGGKYKNRRIKSVVGQGTRPTSDFVREALFNILGYNVIGSIFLDLFAGTGAVGIEALSRGAKKAMFVENNFSAYSIIKHNLNILNLSEKGTVIHSDAVDALKMHSLCKESFDIIFMDPPYYNSQIEGLLSILSSSNMVKSIVVVQHPKEVTFNFSGLICSKRKKYGGTILTFLLKR